MHMGLIGEKKFELKTKVMLVIGRKNCFYFFFLVVKFDYMFVKEEVEGKSTLQLLFV